MWRTWEGIDEMYNKQKQSINKRLTKSNSNYQDKIEKTKEEYRI